MRQRNEDLVEPDLKVERERLERAAPVASDVLLRVEDFAAIARASAYLAGDRSVSPRERSRWRNRSARPKRNFAIGSKIRKPDYLPKAA